ncbi:MAG: DUF4290 domain-containing protein [Rikenellaceae bacterium]
MNDKHYNSQRSKLVLPEYGRHIQYMAKSLRDIEDREERTLQAHAVIAVMGNLNSQLRDTTDFRHKLWDHLFIMAGFDLDVDSPYPIPSDEALMYKPQKLCYPAGKLTYKQYGNNIRRVIDLIKDYDEDVREIIALDVSKFMKFKSYEYNQEFPSDEVIINDIKKFSNGVISLDDDSLNSTKIAYRNSKVSPKSGRRPESVRPGQRTVKYGAGFKKNIVPASPVRRFHK